MLIRSLLRWASVVLLARGDVVQIVGHWIREKKGKDGERELWEFRWLGPDAYSDGSW